MKILEINKLYYPWTGGIEFVAQSIAEGLNDRVDMSVLVCQPKGKSSHETVNGVKVVRASSFGIYFSMPISLDFFIKFWRMAKTADIIQLHVPFPLSDLACLLFARKKKIVLWWHSDIVKQKKIMFFYGPILNMLIRRVDRIVVATQGHIDSSEYIKPFEGKCVIIPYGIRVEEYDCHQAEPILTAKLVDAKAKKVFFAGRLVYYKGVDILLDAISMTHGTELFISGDGTLEGALKEQVKSLGIQNRVHFLGKLSDDELKSAFFDCDLFVLPSIQNSEAFGIVQLEAMISKKPVINTSLPTGVPHVSLDSCTGLTVRPGDSNALAKAIQILSDDDDLRQEMGIRAEKRARELFDLKYTINQLFALYLEVLAK
jgi:rhamnosyl/mannosyltransferase